jgi:hypothetical protein
MGDRHCSGAVFAETAEQIDHDAGGGSIEKFRNDRANGDWISARPHDV